MSDSDGTTEDAESKARRELLLKVYDAAVNEYRFNVNLGWDRIKFFLLLNSGLIAAGVALLKVAEDSVITSVFLALFFIFLIVLTASGLQTIEVAKGYYREAIFTKTVVERELGLLDSLPNLPAGRDNLSIAVTDGQRDYRQVLSGHKILKKEETGETFLHKTIGLTHSITARTEGMFYVMIAIEIVGAIMAVANAAHQLT